MVCTEPVQAERYVASSAQHRAVQLNLSSFDLTRVAVTLRGATATKFQLAVAAIAEEVPPQNILLNVSASNRNVELTTELCRLAASHGFQGATGAVLLHRSDTA